MMTNCRIQLQFGHIKSHIENVVFNIIIANSWKFSIFIRSSTL